MIPGETTRVWSPTAGRLPQPLDDVVTFRGPDGEVVSTKYLGEVLLATCLVHDALSVPAADVRAQIDLGMTEMTIYPDGRQ